MLEILFIFLGIILSITAHNPQCSEIKSASQDEKFALVYQWQYINFTWPSEKSYQDAVSSKLYIPGNNVILGVKYYKDKLYLALPKVKPGSPVTIGSVSKVPTVQTRNNPLLTPFPNWETHLTNECDKLLQDLQSFEIDNNGIMWVIDGRRIDNLPKKCPPKIVLLDLNQKGKMIQSYVPPEDVCSHETCFMNDLVVDGEFAYITDSSFTDPGLIIYSRKQNRAWKARDTTMFAEEDAIHFSIHGIEQSKSNNINGIALSEKSLHDRHRKLYYTALSAFTLYSIDTEVLQNEAITTKNLSEFIETVGNKTGQSSGAIIDSKGQLYYGLVAEDSVLRWNTSEPFSTKKIIEQNHDLMPMPDSYTFDDQGYMYLMSSNVFQFSAGVLNLEDFNFKLSKLYTGTCSYTA